MVKLSSLKSLYEGLTQAREPFLCRARDMASLTVPSLFPEVGSNEWTQHPDPFQAVGSSGVASMTSKLLVAQFPPGLRFFTIEIDPTLRAATDLGQRAELQRLEAARDQREALLQYHIEQPSFRVRMTEAIKNLLVAGTVVLQRTPKKRWRVWRLPQFVCDVGGDDELIDLVLMELIDSRLLPERALEIPEVRVKADQDRELELYTAFRLREDGRYDTWQEIVEKEIPGTRGTWTREQLPVHVARFEPICGEAYGRSMIERMVGDLASLEQLQESLIELGSEASRLIWGVKPNAVVRPDDLAGAPNGAFRYMMPDDVFAVQTEKLSDLQVVGRVADILRGDIQTQMGLRISVQRDAERVTATEIATLAQDIDATLGGTYSSLSEELQLPVLRIQEAELVREGALLSLDGEPVRTRIIAGLEGLGRQLELAQVTRFVAASSAVPPEEHYGYEVDRGKLFRRIARSTGHDPAELMRRPEEVEKLRKAAAQAAQAQTLGPEIARQGGELVREAVSNGRR